MLPFNDCVPFLMPARRTLSLVPQRLCRRSHAKPPAAPQFFAREGCTMVELGCEEHDRQAASTQFITHTVGRMLGEMKVWCGGGGAGPGVGLCSCCAGLMCAG